MDILLFLASSSQVLLLIKEDDRSTAQCFQKPVLFRQFGVDRTLLVEKAAIKVPIKAILCCQYAPDFHWE